MKKEIHPKNYRLVVFQDMSNGYTFLGKTTAPSKENIKWEDGKATSYRITSPEPREVMVRVNHETRTVQSEKP